MNGTTWTKQDCRRLRALYPTAHKSDVAAAFPGRSWDSIERKAIRMKIKRVVRPYPAQRKPQGPLAPLIALLRRVRIERNISASKLSKKAGYARTFITRWEGPRGSTIGSRPLQDWANALGFELTLVPLQRDDLSPLD